MAVKKRGKSSAHPKPGGELSADERAAVLAVAGELGCMVGAGSHTGKPSMTVLLRDIGAGDIVCKRRRGRKRQTAAARIAELRAREPDLTGPEVARRVGCQPQTVYAVWAKLRAATPPLPSP